MGLTNVLLSIRPKYAEAIMDGSKRYEFRRLVFKNRNVNRAFVYSTAPVQRVIGTFAVGKILRAEPMILWDQLKEYAGIEEDEFFGYFAGRREGYAIEIKDAQPFSKPLDPWEIGASFVPPQSFRYVDWELANNERQVLHT